MTGPGAAREAVPRADIFSGAEWAFVVAWPWGLAGVVALTGTGGWGETPGSAAATVLAAGAAITALVGAPVLARGLEGVLARGMAARAGMAAALLGALALPALVAATLASPSPAGTVPCGAAILALAAYALVRAAALAPGAYPGAAVLWLGGPPFAYYVLLDVLGRRAEWILALGPASGAAWMVHGTVSAWGRFAGAAAVLALAGAALTLVGADGEAEATRAA